jgi:hypothetical protein
MLFNLGTEWAQILPKATQLTKGSPEAGITISSSVAGPREETPTAALDHKQQGKHESDGFSSQGAENWDLRGH